MVKYLGGHPLYHGSTRTLESQSHCSSASAAAVAAAALPSPRLPPGKPEHRPADRLTCTSISRICQRMIRRFANIVVEKGSSGNYSLHRLDVSKRLFYPSTAVADAASKETGKMATLRLPAPVMRFHPLPTGSSWGVAKLDLFALLSPHSSEDKIFCSDSAGHNILYQADSNSIQSMPAFNSDKGLMPATISVARPDAPLEDLYVLSSVMSSFEVLSFSSRSRHEDVQMSRKHWHWEPLPPPPFTAHLCSHTVVGDGNTICVSDIGSCGCTYYFDTVKREWRKAAGDWVLPFAGRAEYIPDLKLWLGFAAGSHNLCAWDLSVMDKPPTLLVSTDIKTPEDWSATRLNILNLGSGRFCIAKIFQVVDNTAGASGWDIEDKFAVLTGVEMVMGGGEKKIERITKQF
ncbi:hypothetical protein EJB05_15056, partial [Eragrostis curvula]